MTCHIWRFYAFLHVSLEMMHLKFEISCFQWSDLVEPQMLKLYEQASSLILANITMDIFDDLDEIEVRLVRITGTLLNGWVLNKSVLLPAFLPPFYFSY